MTLLIPNILSKSLETVCNSASLSAMIKVCQVIGWRPLPSSHSLKTALDAWTLCWWWSLSIREMLLASKWRQRATSSHAAAIFLITLTVLPFLSRKSSWWSFGIELTFISGSGRHRKINHKLMDACMHAYVVIQNLGGERYKLSYWLTLHDFVFHLT